MYVMIAVVTAVLIGAQQNQGRYSAISHATDAMHFVSEGMFAVNTVSCASDDAADVPRSRASKNVIFCIDTSGSMGSGSVVVYVALM